MKEEEEEKEEKEEEKEEEEEEKEEERRKRRRRIRMGVDGGRGKRKQKVIHFFHLQNNIINAKLRSYVLARAPPSIKTHAASSLVGSLHLYHKRRGGSGEGREGGEGRKYAENER